MSVTRSGTAPSPLRPRRTRLAARDSGLPLAVGFGHVGRGCPLVLVDEAAQMAEAVLVHELDPPVGRTASGPWLRLLPAFDGPARPAPLSLPLPVTLTARGRCAVAVGALVVGAVLVTVAWFGAQGASTTRTGPMPARVVVHDGDTLWSIALRIAPGRDPRDEVSDLRRLNGLVSTVLAPGRSLRTK